MNDNTLRHNVHRVVACVERNWSGSLHQRELVLHKVRELWRSYEGSALGTAAAQGMLCHHPPSTTAAAC